MTATSEVVRHHVDDIITARTLIVHEWLYMWAGSERCLQEIAELLPHADVVIGSMTNEARARFPIARRAKESWLRWIPGSRRYHRWFLPLHAAAFASIDTSNYDLVISLSHSMGKLVRAREGGAHLCYCFSPPRYLWDLRETYGKHAPVAQSVALRLGAAPLRLLDRRGAAGVDRFVSISHCVADRVRRAYGRDSEVVYPPVAPKGTTRRKRESFLLTLGRLVPYKRVDLAIRAANAIGMPLVVAGEGPERSRLEKLANGRTTFVGHVSEQEAGQLMSSCAAFVFCAEEDFGIAPLEANAHGAPVVAYAGGAAAETISEGESGVFFTEQSVSSVVDALERCLRQEWDEAVVTSNAARFSPERFRQSMMVEIARALSGG